MQHPGARPAAAHTLAHLGAQLGAQLGTVVKSLVRSGPHRAAPLRIRRITRVVRDVMRAEAFYVQALGFTALRREAADLEELGAIGATDNDGIQSVLRLGDTELVLLQFMYPCHPAPEAARSNDLSFLNLAIAVADIDAAFAHLGRHKGWHPVSQTGPQTMPPSSGGIRAYKLRDPDGQLVQLLWFPPGQGRTLQQAQPRGLFLEIDHAAVSVSVGWRSLEFYRSLGFRAATRSLSRGAPQARLDSIPAAHVHITALHTPAPGGPGLALLAYRPPGRAREPADPDLPTGWITLAGGGGAPRAQRDPDGYVLLLK